MSEFQNQFCACSERPGQKCKSGSIFKTKIPAPLWIIDFVLVRGADKSYIEFLNEDNYVNVWYIFGRNTYIVPQRDEEERRSDILSIKKDIERRKTFSFRS